MMAPRFSIRQMLIAVVAFAFIASLLGAAGNGNHVAFGLGVALTFSFAPFVIYAVFRGVALMFSSATKAAGYDPLEPSKKPDNSDIKPFQMSRQQEGGASQ